jgi:hypothetical protein
LFAAKHVRIWIDGTLALFQLIDTCYNCTRYAG